jgi:hypothetical protein
VPALEAEAGQVDGRAGIQAFGVACFGRWRGEARGVRAAVGGVAEDHFFVKGKKRKAKARR